MSAEQTGDPFHVHRPRRGRMEMVLDTRKYDGVSVSKCGPECGDVVTLCILHNGTCDRYSTDTPVRPQYKDVPVYGT
jgi:phosphoribulokinase